MDDFMPQQYNKDIDCKKNNLLNCEHHWQRPKSFDIPAAAGRSYNILTREIASGFLSELSNEDYWWSFEVIESINN